MIENLKILNINNLKNVDFSDIRDFCRDRIAKKKGAFLVALNPFKIIKARSDSEFQRILDNADWVFPEAWGVKWAASVLLNKNISVLPGYKVMFSLLDQAHSEDYSVYLLGTTNGILRIAIKQLQKMHPGLRIVGSHNGFYSRFREDSIIKEIEKSEPNFVFVAMGAYRQEKVIEKLISNYPSGIFMGVGGSFDLIANKQPEPPEWIRSNHLEWLFRLYKEPFRIRRYHVLPKLVFLVFFEKIKSFIN